MDETCPDTLSHMFCVSPPFCILYEGHCDVAVSIKRPPQQRVTAQGPAERRTE